MPILTFGQTANLSDSSSNQIADSVVERFFDYTELDIHPTFPGGDAALLKYFADNMKYPDMNDDCFFSKIYFGIVIDKDGYCTNPTIEHCSCELPEFYSDEMKSMFLNMPQWIPGECDGTKVSTKYIIPVNVNWGW